MSNSLSLKKIQSLGMSKYMSAQELEKSISKALLEQEQILNQKEDKVMDLDYILLHGGKFTHKLDDKSYNCSVLTPSDIQLLSDIENDIEQRIEYSDLPVEYKWYVRTAHNNFLCVKARDIKIAQKVVDSVLGKGLYSVSSSHI
jgi:hypothetical protein